MSEPAGMPEAPKNKIFKKVDMHVPYNNMMKKMFNRDKKVKVNLPSKAHIEANSYAMSPEINTSTKHNQINQKSQPMIQNPKFQKEFQVNILNKKNNKIFKNRIYSAVRKSSNINQLEIPKMLSKKINKKRIKSLQKNNVSIAPNGLQLLNIDPYQPTMTLRSNSRGFGSVTRKIGKFWNNTPM